MLVGGGLAALIMASPPDGRAALLTLGLFALALGGMMYGIVRLVHRWWSARRSAAIMPVTVCIRAPIYPVPSLAEAFVALPEHCKRLVDPHP